MINKPVFKAKEDNERSGSMRRPSNEIMQVESCDDVNMAEKKSSFNRYRIHSPKGKRDTKEMIINFSAVQSTNENFKHFKFDTTNNEVYPRTNRNRLPQIPHFQTNFRASSFEQKIDSGRNKHK